MDPQHSNAQHSPLVDHDALALLLQHPSIVQDLQLICSLLCVSKGMRISIAQQCRQQLDVTATVTQAPPLVSTFAAWLRRWAGLARTLELSWDRMPLPDVEGLLSEALTAAAVPDAAADVACAGGRNGLDTCTGPLRVVSLKANVAGPLLLGQLPASTLTCVELGHVNDYPCHETAAAALARLTGLQDLTVLSASSHLLLPAAACLTALSRACLLLRDLPLNASKLQHLPPQLRKLEVTVGWAAGAAAGSSSSRRPQLPLQHLTGLLELRGSGYFALQTNDQLPGGLVSLQVPDCPAAKPLLHLTHLTTLNMYNSTARAAQLVQIAAALPQLNEVSLGYFGAEDSPDVDAAAPGWPGLPLRSLDFDSNSGEFRLGAPALDALGRLGSCLTQLALSGGVLVEATPSGLAQVLSRLSKLHTLRLASVEVLHEPPLSAIATPTQQQQQQQQQQRQGRLSDASMLAAMSMDGPAAGPAAAAGAVAAAAAAAEAPAGPETAGPSSSAAAGAAPAAEHSSSSRRSTRSSGGRVEYLGAAYRVMAAVAGLRSLRSLKLGGLTGWLINVGAELQPLSGATQLTCLHLMDMDLSDDVVLGLVRGLGGLRELDVSDNASLGDGALGHIGGCLPLLRNLDVSCCAGVSDAGIKGLKEKLPWLDVVCFQSSEEEWL